MPIVLAEQFDNSRRAHTDRLGKLLRSTTRQLHIASPYVTETGIIRLLSNRETRLLTSLSIMDVVSGATSLDALSVWLDAGVQIAVAEHSPKLHAKVYIFGDSDAIVSSANLTTLGLNENIEVGVALSGEPVHKLAQWYEKIWRRSTPLKARDIDALREEAKDLRSKFEELRKKVRAKRSHFPPRHVRWGTGGSSDRLVTLFDTAQRFFVCNTDRKSVKDDRRERLMRRYGYAAAWETFSYTTHMERVKPGDAILMFANRIGIVGVGRAESRCEKKRPGSLKRVWRGSSIEWRLRVTWLDWRDAVSAYPCDAKRVGRVTFKDITDEYYRPLRADILEHFRSD